MNAIVGLCHFCDAHGPCILFCTQAFHSAQDAQLLMDSVPPDKRMPYTHGVGVTRSHDQSCAGGGNGTSSETENQGTSGGAAVSSLIHLPPHHSPDQCDGCSSVSSDQPGFISYDDQAQISYVSGQYPEQAQLYSVLRQACVRSLNCEVCPGREGPIVFGEDNGCHVLSHTFNLQDYQARGFSSLYSLIVVMMDRVFLINSWPFLVKHFRKLIDDLQAKADKVYASDSDESKSASSRSLRSSISSLDHLRRFRTNQTGRSLVEITGDSEVFVHLHKYFVFLLKAGGQRVIECVLEGPPRVMAVSRQRSISQSQEGSLDENGSFERPLNTLEFQVISVEGQPLFQSLKHLFSVLDRQDFAELAYHILKGDQLIVRGNDITTVTSIINILKDLIPDTCCHIVTFSSIYKEPFVCNFIGLSVGVELPPHVVASDLHVLLDILPPLRRHYSKLNDDPYPLQLQDLDPLRNYKLMVYSAAQRLQEQKYPILLQRLMSLLSGEISDNLINRGVSTLKDDWMNKVKVLYKFSQMGHMDHPQRNDRLTKLLTDILLVGIEELPLLQYWRSALSKDYKTHLIRAEKS